MKTKTEKRFDKQYPCTGKKHIYYGSLKEIAEQKAIFVPQEVWIKDFIQKELTRTGVRAEQ